MRALLLGLLLVLSLFAAQLVRLQGLDAASVSAAALDGRLAVKTIPAGRGTITDIDGAELAVSTERKRVTADPTLVQDFTVTQDGEVVAKGYAAAAQIVAEVTGAKQSSVLEKLTEPDSPRSTVLVPDISPQKWQELRKRDVRGVFAESYMRRDYPLGESAAQLIGWVGAGDQPAGGLELVRNSELVGTPGEAVYEQGRTGEVISTGLYREEPAQPGSDLRLSLDADMQWYIYDAVRKRVKESGGLSGYAVVQEVRTGRVVGMASYPSFDPADTTQDVAKMRNAAVEDVYEPGSTAKLITAAAALEEGIIEPQDPIEVPSGMRRGGSSFKDVEPHPVLHLTFAGVLAKSSNMGTLLYGEKLPGEKLYEWIGKFGLGSPTGHGLPGESPGLVPEPKTWSATTHYTFMYGQGLSGTLLQQVGVFQTVANNGVHLPPSFVAGTTDPDGRYTEVPVAQGKRIISEKTATTLTRIMQQIPAVGGTAPDAAVPGYHVAGKTSTASRIDPTTGGYSGVTASFMGFAPAEDPEYVVAVVVQRPTRISEYGGVIAGPVFSSIMRYALQKEGIEPATSPPVTVPLEYDPAKQAPGEEPGVTLGEIAVKDEGTP